MVENWRPVVGFEALYEVSDQGRVRSRRRKGSRGGVLAATIDSGGYRLVGLYQNGGRAAARRVHTLVAEAFIGALPEGQEVRHLDGDALNCAAGNLAYGDRLLNMADQRRHGTHANTRKTHCPQRHPYTPENTKVEVRHNGRTYRRCLTCKRERGRKRGRKV